MLTTLGKRRLPLADEALDVDREARPRLAVTLRCDLSCHHCSSRAGHTRSGELSIFHRRTGPNTLASARSSSRIMCRQPTTRLQKRRVVAVRIEADRARQRGGVRVTRSLCLLASAGFAVFAVRCGRWQPARFRTKLDP